MDVSNYSQYKAEQELLNCGLSAESIARIKDTTVITRDGAQHVVPSSQSYLDERQIAQTTESSVQINKSNSPDMTIAESLQRQMQEQNQMFARFKQFSDNRIGTLERQLESALNQIKDILSAVNTLQSNRNAQIYHEQKSQSHKPVQQESQDVETSTQEFPQAVPQRRPTCDKPIDRNGVAPSDINVEKMFYFGNK